MPSGPSYVVHKTRAGLAVVGVAGVISAMTTTALLGYIVIRARRGGSQSALAKGVRSFLHSPMGWYFISLTVCDCLQAFAFGANFYWVPSNSVYAGRFCDMQGFISQIGDLGAVVWSVAIAYQTFFLLFLQRKPAPWIPLMTLAIGWTLVFALPIIGSTTLRNADVSFWGDSGAWCWISANHTLPRIFFLHFFIYIALLSSLIVYGLIYLKFSGFLEYPRENPVTTTTRWPMPTSHSRPASYADTVQESDVVTSHLAKIARRLMWYPIVFTFICVPIATCRIRVLLNLDVPFWLYVFAGVLYTSSGTANAALFLATRHAFIQVGASAGVQVTTQQIRVVDPQVDGFAWEPRRRRAYDSKVLFPVAGAPSPGRDAQVAFKVSPGSPGVDSLHTPGDSVVTVLDERGEHDDDPDKTGVHVYPPAVKWAD